MVRHYLNAHGITSYDTVRKYRLGLHEGRLLIPYITPAGVKAIKLRCVEDHDCKAQGPYHAKYDQPEGQKPRLFNVAAFHEAGDIIGVSEGEVDAIVATESLGVPTIGVPGSGHWKSSPFWALTLADFARVIVWADGDDAGKKLADAIKASAKEATSVVTCAPGQDVSSMVAAGRAAELLEAAGAGREVIAAA